MAAPAQRAVGGHDQQEDDPDRGQAAEVPRLVHAIGVHHGERFRQAGLGQVVVKHNAFEAEAGRMGERGEGGGAAIGQEHQPAPLLCEPLERRLVRAVAFGQPVGHMDACCAARCGEKAGEQRGRGCAVHVVVGEDSDRFPGFGGVGEPLRRHVHVVQQGRVRQGSPELRLQKGGRGLRRHAPVGEYPRGDLRKTLPLGNRRCCPRIARPLAPGPAPERAGDA